MQHWFFLWKNSLRMKNQKKDEEKKFKMKIYHHMNTSYPIICMLKRNERCISILFIVYTIKKFLVNEFE